MSIIELADIAVFGALRRRVDAVELKTVVPSARLKRRCGPKRSSRRSTVARGFGGKCSRSVAILAQVLRISQRIVALLSREW